MSFVNSTLNLSGGATLKSEIADASHVGNLAFSGTGDAVTLGGTLEVDPLAGSNVSYGDTFTIISADAISGTFDTLDIPNGWQVNYSPTSVTVTAVPEPAALSLLLAGGVLFARRRRAHRGDLRPTAARERPFR